jgi:hypothetical protein
MSYYQSIHSKAVTSKQSTRFSLESMIYAPQIDQSIDSKLLNESIPYTIENKGRCHLGDTSAQDLKIASAPDAILMMTLT